ncbi:MAG TPA: tellurite resistance/C4-dicarboxylate transporter family protein [Nocardioides sp.]|uniref:Tellurite resistance/C4-dicarboxylate transporter family protein n=1 Tax=Nocardioides panacisoli TaxID=627624 RepID=A0ABP7I6I1_9ACTN|nr:tellurite resistance/C4-dicarboxylate transporter family protein [uncultured Nocardioides sp.]HRD60313.1 tellurite resistance/C4-dicarboxylate transporter family protein [Nocardioides sp.]HRI94308.1 tellurite resistance/C4-dicarboxylate transporter family protein [Nocardioides sp.]HRK44838.1 tellurite resistance/C4-dicarboxylate transporter family protein [Nocardioides sp.]
MAEGLRDRVGRAVEGLTPGYFALVMATGILSVGMHLERFDILSAVLLGVCCSAFVVLLALTGWRLVAYRSAVVEDFTDPRRGFGFFTFVAGTNVLGVRLGIAGFHEATAVLLVLAGVAWLALGYVVPWTAVLGRQERPVLATANGTWFIWVVASQSVAVAAATIEPVFDPVRRELAVLAIMSWSVGVFLYGATGILVSLRLMLYEFGPEELTPPYWVSMGALAITVLAGARIVEMADAPMVAVTRDLIAGLAVVFWAFATWLIPVLVAAGWWRHVRRRVPLRYEATLWSIIFPLGMYAVAGIYLGRADHLPVVEAVGRAELWVAFPACVLVFAIMLVHLFQTVIAPTGPHLPPLEPKIKG